MADITISVGGRAYPMSCKDGEELYLERLAAIVDEKVMAARKLMPGLTAEPRVLLFAALFLADEVEETRHKHPATDQDATKNTGATDKPQDDPAVADALERLAGRLESLADRLAPALASS